MSLLLKRSLCSRLDALGRSEGSRLVSSLICSVRTGQFLHRSSETFPFFRSPSVCTRSISVPNGWNNSTAITPTLYISDCEHKGRIPLDTEYRKSKPGVYYPAVSLKPGLINNFCTPPQWIWNKLIKMILKCRLWTLIQNILQKYCTRNEFFLLHLQRLKINWTS